MLLVLGLVPAFKQQFNECNFIELINTMKQTNKH